jgi:hypothetical protein
MDSYNLKTNSKGLVRESPKGYSLTSAKLPTCFGPDLLVAYPIRLRQEILDHVTAQEPPLSVYMEIPNIYPSRGMIVLNLISLLKALE